MKKTILLMTLIVALAAAGYSQTEGYLYYVAGAVPTTGDANPTLDGTLTGDNGVFSVLVADVRTNLGLVNNWRYATDATNRLQGADAGDANAYTWLFIENAVHVYNGRLYVGPGDWNGDSARATADLVAWADINEADGSLGPWTYSANIAPGGTDIDQAISATAIVDTGSGVYYYVLGGTSGLSSRVAYALIDPNTGALGAWQATTAPLPNATWFNRAVTVGNSIVHVGGNGVPDFRAHYATPAASGDITAWNDGGLPDPGNTNDRWDHGIVAANVGGTDYVYSIAGRDGVTGTAFGVDTVHYSAIGGGGAPAGWNTSANLWPDTIRKISAVAVDDLIIAMGAVSGGNAGTATTNVWLGSIAPGGDVTWTQSSNSSIQPRSFGGLAFHPYDLVEPTSADGTWALYE